MEVIVVADEAEVAGRAADVVDHLLRNDDRPVLGLCTGASPRATYAELARRHREEGLRFDRTHVFHLDEYVGFGPGHPRSYSREIDEQLVGRVDLDPEAVHLLDGCAHDLEEECRA